MGQTCTLPSRPSDPALLQRFQGSMVGAVVGDCIGGVFERSMAVYIGGKKVLNLIEEIEADPNSHPEKEGQERGGKKTKDIWTFTDDTAMARSVAKSLIKYNGLNTTDMAKRFTSEYFNEKKRGYGPFVRDVFEDLKVNNCKDVFGPAQEQFNGEGSYGNGGAMRIGPAALFSVKKNMDFDQIRDFTEKMTRITHTHHNGILGAILQCYAVNLAAQTEKLDIDEFIDALLEKIRPLEEEMTKGKPVKQVEKDGRLLLMEREGSKPGVKGEDSEGVPATYCHKLEIVRLLVKQETDPPATEVVSKLGVFIAALDSVPVAIYCVFRGMKEIEGISGRNAFERTIIYAISLGGDVDTVATMAGAIAGAYYGLDIIPELWQLRCEGVKEAKRDAELLYNLSRYRLPVCGC